MSKHGYYFAGDYFFLNLQGFPWAIMWNREIPFKIPLQVSKVISDNIYNQQMNMYLVL